MAKKLVPDTRQNPAGSSSGSVVGEFIERAELAQRLNVHERTIRRMVERGELPRPCVGEGGRPRWLWCYVLEYCRKHHENTTKIDRKLRSELNR